MVRFDGKARREGRKYVNVQRAGSGGSRRSSGLGRSRVGGARMGGGRGAGGGMPPMGKAGGIGGLLIMLLIFLVTQFVGGGGGTLDAGGAGFGNSGGGAGCEVVDEEMVDYMGALMADLDGVWHAELSEYQGTTMNIFCGSIQTNGCGGATSASGPFYCPAPQDQMVYIDLDFYDDLSRKFGAPGDFAQAYVIAHEVGHHVQSTTHYVEQLNAARRSYSKNEASVRQELQADCFAGVWAFSAERRTNSDGTAIIERGDIEEGLAAAASVGDDRIQDMMGQQVNPHNWTHGSAAARQHWFTKGLNSGDPDSCDTYSVSSSEVGL